MVYVFIFSPRCILISTIYFLADGIKLLSDNCVFILSGWHIDTHYTYDLYLLETVHVSAHLPYIRCIEYVIHLC